MPLPGGCAGSGVFSVFPCQDIQQQHSVPNRAGHWAGSILGIRQRQNAGAADEAHRGLEANNAAEIAGIQN
ncbi:hypothetical protein D3C76_1459340 [compost metagenome]